MGGGIQYFLFANSTRQSSDARWRKVFNSLLWMIFFFPLMFPCRHLHLMHLLELCPVLGTSPAIILFYWRDKGQSQQKQARQRGDLEWKATKEQMQRSQLGASRSRPSSVHWCPPRNATSRGCTGAAHTEMLRKPSYKKLICIVLCAWDSPSYHSPCRNPNIWCHLKANRTVPRWQLRGKQSGLCGEVLTSKICLQILGVMTAGEGGGKYSTLVLLLP